MNISETRMKLNRKRKTGLILFIVLFLMFLILLIGTVENLRGGKGFLFIPAFTSTITPSCTSTRTSTQTSTATFTATPTLTMTLTLTSIPSGTPDLHLYLTAGAATYAAQEKVTLTAGLFPEKSLTAAAATIYSEVTGTEAVRFTPEPTETLPETSEGAVKISPADGMLQIRQGNADEGSESFWIDQHEVTNAQYLKCVSSGTCSNPEKNDVTQLGDQLPVVNINWNQANAYCIWAGRILPGKEEWKAAADKVILPDESIHYEEKIMNIVNCNRESSGVQPAESHPSGNSVNGVEDLLGNAWEWVSNPGIDPGTRVIMGGSWNTFYGNISQKLEGRLGQEESSDDVGFRCIEKNSKAGILKK